MLAIKLKQLQDRLNDLGKDNKNIRLTKLNAHFLDLTILPKERKVSVKHILDHLVYHRKSNGLKITESQSPQPEEMRLMIKCKELHQAWTHHHTETGERALYLGFPFLSGTLQDGSLIHGPLLFYPVELKKEDGDWMLGFEEEGEPVWNRALILAVQQANEIRISEDKLEQVLHELDSPYESRVYIQKLWEWGLPISSPIPSNVTELIPLEEYVNGIRSTKDKEKKKSASWDEVNAPLSIVPHAIIGQFTQGRKGISKDYQALIKQVEEWESGDLLSVLLNEAVLEVGQGDLDRVTHVDQSPEEDNFFLLESDFSQEEVILSARYEKGLVIDGPPGSGKSQVIVNLIADTIRHGKPVMLVAEKKAALTVVYQRLQELGLEDHVALVHEEKEDRKPLYDKISKLLESPPQMGLETAKDQYIQLSKEIAVKTEYLNSIARTLWNPQPNGISLFKMYDQRLPYRERQSRFRLPSPGYDLSYEQLTKMREKLERLGRYAMRYNHADYAWKNRKSTAAMTWEQRNQWLVIFDSLLDHLVDEEAQRQSIETRNVSASYLLNNLAQIQKGHTLLQHVMKRRWFSQILWNFWVRKHKDLISRIGISSFKSEQEKLSEQLKQIYKWVASRQQVEGQLQQLIAILDNNDIRSKHEGWQNGESLTEWVESLRQTLQSDWDSLKQADLEVENLSPVELAIYEKCFKEYPPIKDQNMGTHWWEAVYQAYLEHWIHLAEEGNRKVRDTTEGEYDLHRDQYKKMLDDKRDVAANYIRLRLHRQLIEINEKDRKDIIYRCKQKSKPWPIRKLLQTYPDIVSKIIPIWLVSPETASAVFPLQNGLFDLVIFDEASQCPAEHGIPALYRGRRLVIAGDDKQLRPTKIGKKSFVYDEDDADYIEDIQEVESLLELAGRTFTRKSLKWHYRSKFEELINFSNHAFYKNIQVAPNVLPTADPPAIQWVNVDGGVWINNSNMEEAKQVVDLIAEHYRRGDERSMGVVTFNKPQADLIERLIKQRIADDPEFAMKYDQVMSGPMDSTLTVRNIENIQGDERDIIIFSIAYAFTPQGEFKAQFGSLNQAGGENRLNVAITRAKQGIRIVCSIHPSELPGNETNPGVYFFKRYLEYAYATAEQNLQGAQAVLAKMNADFKMYHDSQGPLVFDSLFEEEVYNALVAKGYIVRTQVGASTYRIDLAIVDPNNPSRYLLGIECDGAMYHSSKTARERDVMRQRFLEKRGWTIERIWSRNWWKRPQDEVARIEEKIRELMSTDIQI